ncbi:MAG TPA: hypothetical protein VHL52_10110 [Acidimicrobiia bacterium]|nr:hypothetical protein [Acidimicrobiia bacterium]
MASADEDVGKLRELVADERARRARTEKQLAAQKAETARWRRRARQVELASKAFIRLPTFRSAPTVAEPASAGPVAFPAIRAGIGGAPTWLVRAMETVDLVGLDEAGLAMLDVVIVGGGSVVAGVEELIKWPVRPPLIAFSPTGELERVLATTECAVVVGDSSVPAVVRVGDVVPLGPLTQGYQSEPQEIARRVTGGLDRTVASVTHELLRSAGLGLPSPIPTVSTIAVTNRPDRVRTLLETLRALQYADLRIELGTHGFTLDFSDRQVAESWFGDRLTIREFPEQWPLGRCLNEVIEGTTSNLWAKIDDDDFYGPTYLQEAVIELLTTGAELVGKQTHHLYDSTLDRTYLLQPGNEYRDTAYVPGATFVGRRGAWERVPFAHRRARVDSTFVRGMGAVGLSIYSTSRFEFAVGRGGGDHTWHVDETFYQARGRPIGDGFRRDDIFLPAMG